MLGFDGNSFWEIAADVLGGVKTIERHLSRRVQHLLNRTGFNCSFLSPFQNGGTLKHDVISSLKIARPLRYPFYYRSPHLYMDLKLNSQVLYV